MKFRVSGEEWCKKLSVVMPAVPPQGKAEKQWAEYLLVEASESDGGKITIVTTDIRQIGMKISLKAVVERPGKVLLPRQTHDLTELLQKDGELTFDFDEQKSICELSTAAFKGKLPCSDPANFRVLGLDEDDSAAKKFDLPMNALKIIVETVAPSADPKDVETGKSGVLLRCEQKLDADIPEETTDEVVSGRRVPTTYAAIKAGPSRLVAVAVDGKKLSKYECVGLFDDADASYFSVSPDAKRPFERIPSFEMMVPAGLLTTSYKSLSSLSEGKDKVNVSVFGGFITLRAGSAAIALRMLSASLPNWRRVLAHSNNFTFVVSTEDLKNAVQIASISNLGNREGAIVAYVEKDAISVGNAVVGEDKTTRALRTVKMAKGTLPTGFVQGFRPEHFSQAIGYIKTDYIWIDFAEKTLPVICHPCKVVPGSTPESVSYEADEDFLALIMPVRINA